LGPFAPELLQDLHPLGLGKIQVQNCCIVLIFLNHGLGSGAVAGDINGVMLAAESIVQKGGQRRIVFRN
jgi:hypothetical protein